MEFAASALTSLASAGSGVAAAAAPVASAVSTGASAFGGFAGTVSSFLPNASLVAGLLSGGASLLQMAQLTEAGEDKAANLELQAKDVPIDIGAENLKGTERRNSLRKSLLASIGERDAAVAASGVDLTFGTPAIAREQAVDEAERALSIDDAGTGFRVSRLNERATNLRSMARAARRSAADQSLVAGIEGAGRMLRRG